MRNCCICAVFLAKATGSTSLNYPGVIPWLRLVSCTATAQNLWSDPPCFICRALSTNWTPRRRTCLTCETLTSWWARMTSRRSATSTSRLCCTTSKSASSTPSSSTPTAVGERLLSAFSVKTAVEQPKCSCEEKKTFTLEDFESNLSQFPRSHYSFYSSHIRRIIRKKALKSTFFWTFH